MRKTSQDGGDSTSVTSGVENEKKPILSILKPKKSSLKRTAPNIAEESDDTVVEPLLQKDKGNGEAAQSAKYFAKAKADTVKEISKLFHGKKGQNTFTTDFGTTETLLSEKDHVATKPNSSFDAPIHNYMNINVFKTPDNCIVNGTTKSQVLVEIDGCKQSGYNPSPLIFTTAKIHLDSKSKNMEPIQMTPGPISSTVEVSVSKGGTITTNEKKISNGTSVMNTNYSLPSNVNEKTKQNSVIASNSNVTVTQCKESDTPITAHTVNSGKSFIPLSNDPVDIKPQQGISKAMPPSIPKEKVVLTEVAKKLDTEPRILMSESKLKSSITENTKPIIIGNTTKPPTKVLESSSKRSVPHQSNLNKNENMKSGMVVDSQQEDSLSKNFSKDSQATQIKNIKSPTVTKNFTDKSNTPVVGSVKAKQEQNNAPTEVSTSKAALNMVTPTSPKVFESLKNKSSKLPAPSIKSPIEPKPVDTKINKETDKSPKPSANDIAKPSSKLLMNNTVITSTKKSPSTELTVVSSPSVSTSGVTSTTASNASQKSVNSSSISISKAITSTVTSTPSSSAVKTRPTSSATSITTTNSKPSTVTSTKSSAKPVPSTVLSIKTPQTSAQTTSAIKQPSTSTAKSTANKPSIPTAKAISVNVKSPGAITPIVKPTTSKAQASTSSTVPSTGAVAAAKNIAKTKEPTNDKSAPKQNDHSKDSKSHKA